jgi:hypothetical protein
MCQRLGTFFFRESIYVYDDKKLKKLTKSMAQKAKDAKKDCCKRERQIM